MSRVLLVFGLTACGRLDFDARSYDAQPATDRGPDSPGLRPIHQYNLDNNYDDVYGGPPLNGHGGTFFSGGYQFGPNEGLTVDGALPPDVYTVDIEFGLSDLAGWRKILDFEGLTQDSGFYIYQFALQFVVVPEVDFVTTEATLANDAQIRVTLTRDASGVVVGYLGAAPLAALRAAVPDPPTSQPGTSFEFDDTAGVAHLTGTTASFFIDDTVTGGSEIASGFARRIVIYDVALTPEQVASTPP